MGAIMSLKRAIRLIEKFAEIPKYPKCKKCGDTDPYLGDDGLCYKCFDQNKSSQLSSSDFEQKVKSLDVFPYIRQSLPIYQCVLPPYKETPRMIELFKKIARKETPAEELNNVFNNTIPESKILKIQNMDSAAGIAHYISRHFIDVKFENDTVIVFGYSWDSPQPIVLDEIPFEKNRIDKYKPSKTINAPEFSHLPEPIRKHRIAMLCSPW